MTQRRPVRRVPAKQAREQPESVQAGDFIEYGITVELQPQPGQKAWVKFGTTSQVRDGETTRDAVDRIAKFVEDGLDERIDAQSE